MKVLISICLSLILSSTVHAEGKSNGGDDFRNTATEYQVLAKKYGDKGYDDIASMYQRMAEIKLEAAAKADKGKWDDIDWSEYHEVEGKIAKLKQAKKHKK